MSFYLVTLVSGKAGLASFRGLIPLASFPGLIPLASFLGLTLLATCSCIYGRAWANEAVSVQTGSFVYTWLFKAIVEHLNLMACLLLFSVGAASGHCVHRGGVCVQDPGHREKEAL